MKWVKQYILPLLTFLLIAAGAAMPFAVSWVQDNRISGLQEEFPLSTVNFEATAGYWGKPGPSSDLRRVQQHSVGRGDAAYQAGGR